MLVNETENNLRFPGQYEDGEAGLYYNFHRYYDPSTGRYTAVDPLGLEGGINVYTYAYSSPIHRVDPLGLRPSDAFVDGGAHVTVGVTGGLGFGGSGSVTFTKNGVTFTGVIGAGFGFGASATVGGWGSTNTDPASKIGAAVSIAGGGGIGGDFHALGDGEGFFDAQAGFGLGVGAGVSGGLGGSYTIP